MFANKITFSQSLFLVSALLLANMLAGCAGTSGRTDSGQPDTFSEEGLNPKIEAMLTRLLAGQRHDTAELAPAAVVPGSLKQDSEPNRLEELAMERLASRLRQNREIISLSRQNWLEYRDGRTLSAAPDSLIIYEVIAGRSEIPNRIRLKISAAGASGRKLPGLMAETTFAARSGAPAAKLLASSPE